MPPEACKSILNYQSREKYLAKLKTVVNGLFKEDHPSVSLKLSMEFDVRKSIYMPLEEIGEDIAPVVFDCAKSKMKQNREETLCKTYYMLYDIEKPLPLARVRQAFEELASGKKPVVEDLYKNMVFEKWEDPESLRREKFSPKPLSISSNDDREGIVKAVACIAERADEYILQTRFLRKYIEVENKADKEALDETGFFALAANYPETERDLVIFIEKLNAYGKEYPTTFDYPGSSRTPIPVGATAAAALALLGGKKYDSLIASYLETIKELRWYRVSCVTMRNLWKDHNAAPDVPMSIAVMWRAED